MLEKEEAKTAGGMGDTTAQGREQLAGQATPPVHMSHPCAQRIVHRRLPPTVRFPGRLDKRRGEMTSPGWVMLSPDTQLRDPESALGGRGEHQLNVLASVMG